MISSVWGNKISVLVYFYISILRRRNPSLKPRKCLRESVNALVNFHKAKGICFFDDLFNIRSNIFMIGIINYKHGPPAIFE